MCENVMKITFGTKDTIVVWEDLKKCGIQLHLWLQDVGGRIIKLATSFVLLYGKKGKVSSNYFQFENTISLCVVIEEKNLQ